jgi:Gluconolactonase
MTWQFELVAGPYQGPTGGVVWHEGGVLFSVIDEGLILRFDPETRAIAEFRRYANRVNGLAHGPGGELYGAQEGGRRLVEFTPGRTARSRSMRRSTASTTTSPAISWSTAATDSGSPIRAMRRSRSAPRSFLISTTPRCSAWSATTAAHGWPRASPTTPLHPARCCCRRTRRRSMSRTGNRVRTSGGSYAPIPSVLTAAWSPRGAAHVRRGPSRRPPRDRRHVPRCGG